MSQSTSLIAVLIEFHGLTDQRVIKGAESVIRSKFENKESTRTTVTLFNKSDTKSLRGTYHRLRNEYIKATIPWLGGNVRVISPSMFEEFKIKVDGLRDEFNDAVEKFIDKYDRDERRRQLGKLAYDLELPTKDELRGRFNVNVKYEVISGTPDSLLDQMGPVGDVMRPLVEKTRQDEHEALVAELYDRARIEIERFEEVAEKQLEGSKVRMTPTRFNDFKQMITMIESFNIMGDDRITKMLDRVKRIFTTVESLQTTDSVEDRKRMVEYAKSFRDDQNDLLGA